jgi:hypothetical protein
MPIASETPLPTETGAKKTGRRANPAIDGPRDRTVCFMLSEAEKEAVDRLAFCMNLTRSGVLANVIAQFVAATGDKKAAKAAEKALTDYLDECRQAVKARGDFADKTLAAIKGGNK